MICSMKGWWVICDIQHEGMTDDERMMGDNVIYSMRGRVGDERMMGDMQHEKMVEHNRMAGADC